MLSHESRLKPRKHAVYMCTINYIMIHRTSRSRLPCSTCTGTCARNTHVPARHWTRPPRSDGPFPTRDGRPGPSLLLPSRGPPRGPDSRDARYASSSATIAAHAGRACGWLCRHLYECMFRSTHSSEFPLIDMCIDISSSVACRQ